MDAHTKDMISIAYEAGYRQACYEAFDGTTKLLIGSSAKAADYVDAVEKRFAEKVVPLTPLDMCAIAEML